MIAFVPLASVIETLAALANPWKDLYDDSTALSVAVVFLHLAALVVGGGLAIASDRATLRMSAGTAEDRTRHLVELARAHRTVLGALVLSFLTGALLFFADVETFATSLVFWGKMTLVALLLLNGFLMTRVEKSLTSADDAGWKRLRVGARASCALWIVTLLAGVALTNA